ncbi:Structural protein 1 [Frankliniella fusca]|uniref:Structural protein 1 n=1 Tax=Frankliniella fusca TaxID=407009 RepID=A0AAE1LQH1_9NEOP|nr:Structural protein 1 [Frankliniella fusca]
MARYVLKLPPLPQMGYYQEAHPTTHTFPSVQQVRSTSVAPPGLRPNAMGGGAGRGGGCAGGGPVSSDEDGGGCLEGLRVRRGPRGRRGRGSKGMPSLLLEHDNIKFTAPQLARADAVLADIIRDDLPMQGDVAPGVEAVCERLVQRLLCAVGAADPRFASKYLVCLDRRTSGEVRVGPTRFPTRSTHLEQTLTALSLPQSESLTLEYLVRLDALSSPALYPGDPPPPCRVLEGAAQEAVPQGYARLRISPSVMEQWSELLSPNGFIRRDKVQERFVELLAAAAAPVSSPAPRPAKPPAGGVPLPAPTPAPRGPRGPHSPLQVDESRLCGAPGKVVDAAVLADLLALPADGQLFLASGTERYPDPRDARIAIVEGSPWVRLRLGLTRDVLVKLVLGVGVDRWPRGSDLPARVPLTHPDCLLYQHAAAQGCFLVAAGPPPVLRCDDRPCTWQVWAPGAEAALLRHFGARSAVQRALRGLGAVRRALALRAVSRHALRSLLLWRLEDGGDLEDGDEDLLMARWLPSSAPLHVIAVLDRLIANPSPAASLPPSPSRSDLLLPLPPGPQVCVLRGASERSYLFPSLHLLSASARQGAPLSEDALLGDAAALAAFLRRLHVDCSDAAVPQGLGHRGHAAGAGVKESRRSSQQSWTFWPGEEAASGDCWGRLEEVLLPAWSTAVKDSSPPAATRSRRLGFRASSAGGGGSGSGPAGPATEAAHFTPRQLQYIGALLRGLLLCRAMRIEGPSTHSWFPGTMRRHPFATLSSASSTGTLRSNSSAGSDPKRAVAQEHEHGPVAHAGEGPAATADAEDVACLVAVVLEHARAHALTRRGSDGEARSRSGRSPSGGGSGGSPPRRRRTSSSSAASGGEQPGGRGARARRARADSVFRRRYNAAVDLLLEAIRSDPGVVVPADDTALVGCVLRWLLASADRAPRALASPLRRYLRALARAAHRTAGLHSLWAAARERGRDELAALAAFCRLVDQGRAQPVQGAVEAADKGWEWARWLLRLSGRLPGGVHAVLAPAPGRVLRFSLPCDALPARWQSRPGATAGVDDDLHAAVRSRSGSSSRASKASSAASTMTPAVARVYRAALAAGPGSPSGSEAEEDEAWEPLHGRLRQASPLSALLLQRHRQGLHRAIGDLLPALVAMHKFSLVQEAASTLPEPHRSEALDGVARIARETRRRSAARSRITPTSTLRREAQATADMEAEAEVYRVTDEHALGGGAPPDAESPEDNESLTEADRHLEQELRRMKMAESLIGTCRAARAPSHLRVELATMFDDPAGSTVSLRGSRMDLESPVHPTTLSTEGQYGVLEQTHDRQLRLGPPPGHPGYPKPRQLRQPAKKSDSHKKREALTKL